MKWFCSTSLFLLWLVFFSQCSGCQEKKSHHEEANKVEGIFRDWESIKQSDTLRVGTMTSPTDFYVYRDQNFGLEYQKISEFSNEHKLHLDIKISNSLDSLLLLLEEGQIDLCLTPLPMSQSNVSQYLFAGIPDTTSLVMVQRQSDSLVNYITDLAGKTVLLESNSAAEVRIQQIQDEIGHDIHIIRVDTLMSEDLMVLMDSVDSIQFVVAENRSAQVISQFFPKLDTSLQLSSPIRHSWVVSKNNTTLKSAIDEYFCTPEREIHYRELLREDSHLRRFFNKEKAVSHARLMQNGDISPFDHLFKKEATRLGWHWTYLAAIAYHESGFDSDVIGWSGARGLMGIMPSTGAGYGASIEQLLDPSISVRVAVDCLLDYGKRFKELPNIEDQICFTLASYNAGNGHILDAIRLAQKYNAPTDKWYGGVREYVLLKSNPNYYNDPVVKFGYMRGSETALYVDKVMQRQAQYQAIAKK